MEKEHVIIGTAGHIDHGKSSLVKALTGQDPDTLPEEKLRGMTIELGFIFMDNPSYEKQIVFIDVPGHEKFIKTMAAGASNIDAALLVIAADEGIAVQTREHFDILQLLGVPCGVVALTKSDLVDASRLTELESSIRHFVRGTFLEGAPIIPVSALTGSGVEEVRLSLLQIGRGVRRRPDNGVFRMPVDRVFTMHGFGTVVAGTVLSGEVKAGDSVEIFPEKIRSRVRGVQVHKQKAEVSGIGRRTALNLQDAKKEDLRRGQTVGKEGSLVPASRLDARLLILKDCPLEVKHRDRVRLHVGTDEVIARISVLEDRKIQAGESVLVQFVLESPTVALPGDRFFIRSFSPLLTVGGGTILDANPGKHKRCDPETLAALRRLEGTPAEAVEQMFLKSGHFSRNIKDVAASLGRREEEVRTIAADLAGKGRLIPISPEKDGVYLHGNSYRELGEKAVGIVKTYLESNPHHLYIPFSELRSQFLRWSDAQALKAVVDDLVGKNILFRKEAQVGLVGHELRLKPKEQDAVRRVEELYREMGFAAPLEEDAGRDLDLKPEMLKNTLASLIQQGRLIRLAPKVTYHQDTVGRARDLVLDHIRKHSGISIAELRDSLRLSRKYAQAILEYFDEKGLTKRAGDRHILP